MAKDNSSLAFTIIKNIRLISSSNARSAVRVFTGEAGEAFELFFAVFALKFNTAIEK
jgi:hypothetical protein